MSSKHPSLPWQRLARYAPVLALALPLSAQQANQQTGNTAANNGANTTNEEELIVLSPFQVDSTKDKGYYAENTLAGSRIKSNLADLASSISVVTKQQMEDTASLDINDVFRYEANTEGSSTYTPLIVDRGTAKDTVSGYSFGNNGDATMNAQSNRVRGLAAPDIALNYYPASRRVPFDAYNTQSIEISRGPNSLLFGLGTPAGIVNQSTATASTVKDTNSIGLRTDNYGTMRGSFAVNRALIKDKLGIYVAGLYNNQQFDRKPSYDLTRRQYAAVTYRPFQKTTLRASFENYRNDANRPNFLTPRDFVTPWLQSGRPGYDPISRTVTIMDTGVVKGPYVFDSKSPGYVAGQLTNDAALNSTTSPNYVAGINWDQVSRPLLRIDNGQMVDYFQRNPVLVVDAWTDPAQKVTPASEGWVAQDPRYAIYDRRWTSSTNLPTPTMTMDGKTYTIGTYQYPGVTNKAIYDWTKYNTNQANFGYTKAQNYNFEVEQEILPNLHFSAGWLRQDVSSIDNYTISQLTGSTLAIDTNLKLPNGDVNQYFGLPYVQDYTPDTFKNWELSDNYRAMLAYEADFTRRNDWMKWLGKHRLLGMWSAQYVDARIERWRMNWIAAGDDQARLRYMPNAAVAGWNLWNNGSGYMQRNYYLASPGDPQATVTQSTGFWGNKGWEHPQVNNITVYNYDTGKWETASIANAIIFADNGSYKTRREVESLNAGLQSYFLDERIVTTLGWRHDDYKARKTTTGIIKDKDGNVVSAALKTTEVFSDGQADYGLVMNRWDRWDEMKGDTKTIGAAIRPFKGMRFLRSGVENGNTWAEFVDGLTIYVNKSDNFNPPANYQTDYFGKSLPKPEGDGKDIGIGFQLFGNKLVGRVNWFETKATNARTSDAGTLLTRLAYGDTTLMYNWAATIVRIQDGADYLNDKKWNSTTLTDAQIDRVYQIMGLPRDYYAGVSVGGTQDTKAKGLELQLTYNPTNSWTIKVTASKQETTYTNIAPQYDEWKAVRMPVWTSAKAPGNLPATEFTDANGTEYSLKDFWSAYGYSSAAKVNNTDGNTNTQNYFNNNVESQYGIAKALEGAVAANQRKYHASLISNYQFSRGWAKGFSVGGSERYESKAAVGYLGKAADPTRPTVITASDPTKPVYLDNGNYYTDLWIAYGRKIWNDRVKWKIQLNCNDVFENGGLRPIAVNWDGLPYAYRIIDSRQFVLSSTFEF
ncbi:hypothetical protein DB347_12275 [Opitutaceae bacterium EW11]|nr:hypothetical protein DB347_12275 [Opitutaceae bacterium EW11]